MSNNIFVTDDGTWGSADDLFIFDTTNWTDEQYEEFSETSDSDRLRLAKEYSWQKCPKCDYPTHPDALAQWQMCHDCENQSCPECGEIECDHEF